MDLAPVKSATDILASITEAVASLVVALAVLEAALRLPRLVLSSLRAAPGAGHAAKEEVRLRLGRWLALALELELGADILRTAIAPTWSEIGQLAAIAAVRTALNYFLQKEIDRAARAPDSARPP